MCVHYATYQDAAELLLVSKMTARRRLKSMREELGLAPYTRLTMEQLKQYISLKGIK